MLDTRIILSGLWISLMLIYLLGDVLRIVSGDMKPGEMDGQKITQTMLMIMAVIMLVPIVMVFLSLVLPYQVNRWVNIIVAVIVLLFNLMSITTYPSLFDRFLLAVSLGFNLLTVRYAWVWTEVGAIAP